MVRGKELRLVESVWNNMLTFDLLENSRSSQGWPCRLRFVSPTSLVASFVADRSMATYETARIMLLRTASDFDRAPNVTVDAYTAFEAEQGGFEPAIQNILITGRPVVEE